VAPAAGGATAAPAGVDLSQLTEEEIGLLEEAAEAASEEEVTAALNEIMAADVAGIAAKEAAEATREAWKYINPEDLQEATEQAAQFAAQEAAKIVNHMAVDQHCKSFRPAGPARLKFRPLWMPIRHQVNRRRQNPIPPARFVCREEGGFGRPFFVGRRFQQT
jgi:DNA-directed RNA polymerase specialized sigma54-like protein